MDTIDREDRAPESPVQVSRSNPWGVAVAPWSFEAWLASRSFRADELTLRAAFDAGCPSLDSEGEEHGH